MPILNTSWFMSSTSCEMIVLINQNYYYILIKAMFILFIYLLHIMNTCYCGSNLNVCVWVVISVWCVL